MELYFQDVAQNGFNGEDVASSDEWKFATRSRAAVVDGSEKSQSGGFDCNICLDFVQEPVVTLCGHLYCWPCIYKWIYHRNASAENSGHQKSQCPVCKAEVSQQSIVPLYGGGKTMKPIEGKAPHLGAVIPHRPPSPAACGARSLLEATATLHTPRRLSYPQQPQPYYPHRGTYAAMPMLSLSGTTANLLYAMFGMFGEMVCARIFGNSAASSYAYSNPYPTFGGSPRERRQMMQADESLSRVCFFLCCCMVLCLLLF